MTWKGFFMGFLAVMLIGLFFVYWFLPFDQIQFGVSKNPEFNVGNISTNMQFYPNMRFPSPRISYRVEDSCNLQKRSEMVDAFNYLQNVTVLSFYPVNSDEEVTVSCQEESKTTDNGMFIAGEGGPLKIISSENFNVIFSGKILLLRESNCQRPNVEIHELLHVLGFTHSTNINNIMYPVSKCSQTLGGEITNKITKLYSYPELSDLKVQNVSAEISGRYLDLNASIQNIGLKDSPGETLKVYGDNKLLKEMNLKEIKIGYSLTVSLTNIWVTKRTINELKIAIESPNSELSLQNNQVILTTLTGN